jgi:hypothetical protein
LNIFFVPEGMHFKKEKNAGKGVGERCAGAIEGGNAPE